MLALAAAATASDGRGASSSPAASAHAETAALFPGAAVAAASSSPALTRRPSTPPFLSLLSPLSPAPGALPTGPIGTQTAWPAPGEQTPPIPGLFFPGVIGAYNAFLLRGLAGPALGMPMAEIDRSRHPIGSLLGPAALGPGAALGWATQLASMDPARAQYEELSWGGPQPSGGWQGGAQHGGVAPDLTAQPLYFPPFSLGQPRFAMSLMKGVSPMAFGGWL